MESDASVPDGTVPHGAPPRGGDAPPAANPDGSGWESLLAPAGLCRHCRYALLTRTRRGPVYVRCGRAATDPRLRKYPRLPLSECVGFEPLDSGVDPV